MSNDQLETMLATSGLLKMLEEHAGEFGNGMFDLAHYPEVALFANEVLKAQEQYHETQRALHNVDTASHPVQGGGE